LLLAGENFGLLTNC